MIAQATQIVAEMPKSADDLREMSEEQFIELFNYLKVRTCDFKEFPPELLIEYSRHLLPLRLCLELSQKGFADKLGVTKDWARHMEAGRRKIIHLKIANRYVNKINTLLNQRQITLERALKNWRSYQFARDQNLPSVEVKIKSFPEMGEDDFKDYFKLISRETEGFTKFSPNLLIRIPQSVLILRIALSIGHRKFARLIGANSRALRAYEHAKMKMKLKTATKFTENIQRLFGEKSVIFTDALENFRYFKGVYGYGGLNSFLERGLKFAERIPPNALETKIQLLLENAGIPFKMHARVTGLKRDYNVDFAIPDAQTPSVLIEVIQTELMPKKKKNYRHFICQVDHKFQMVKAKHPNIFTALIFYCSGPPLILERAREMIKIETLNTDIYAIKEGELGDFIQKIRPILVEIKKEELDGLVCQNKPILACHASPPFFLCHHVASA